MSTGPAATPFTASYAMALPAARAAVASQHFATGALYMVATPIGNLADISLRALAVLDMAEVLACEDTRHSQQLLRAYGIDKTGPQLLAVHQHNEMQAAQTVISHLQQGRRVAFISDAGTPAISDPGARLARAVWQAGLSVIPLPGPSSVTTVLSAAGVVADDPAHTGFVFAGFLPSKAQERAAAVQALAQQPLAVVLLEAPHRINALADALSALGQRQVTVGRELTKQFETLHTCGALDLPAWLAQDAHRSRGEFALVLHPLPEQVSAEVDTRVLALLLDELPLKTAVKLAAEITGQAKNSLYEQALRLKQA